MNSQKLGRLFLWFGLGCGEFSGIAAAQSTFGSIVGTVVDASGSAIAGAAVDSARRGPLRQLRSGDPSRARHDRCRFGARQDLPNPRAFPPPLEASFTNALNHVNYAPPATNINNPATFGVLESVLPQGAGGNRVGQAALRLDF